MITSAGIGSGLDVESIITQLMSLEREPLNQLANRQEAVNVQLSAIGEFKNTLSDLEEAATDLADTDLFGSYSASTSDEDIFLVNATRASSEQIHEITVNNLATAHQIASDPLSQNESGVIAQRSYTFTSGSEEFSITIDGTNDSVLGLRDAINDSLDNTTIFASVINADSGSRLILTAKNTGTDSIITADSSLFSEMTPARDANIDIDGLSVTSASNQMTDVLPGITLSLVGIGSARMEVNRDLESYRTLLSSFVESYNAVIDAIDTLSENELRGDGTLRTLKSSLSRSFFSAIELGESTVSPYEMGLTFTRDGTLNLDETRLDTSLATNLKALTEAMTDPDSGFGQRIVELLERYTRPDGLLKGREDSYEARISSLETQQERYEFRLEQTENRLRRQFTALDSLVSELQATSDYLTDQLRSISIQSSPER